MHGHGNDDGVGGENSGKASGDGVGGENSDKASGDNGNGDVNGGDGNDVNDDDEADDEADAEAEDDGDADFDDDVSNNEGRVRVTVHFVDGADDDRASFWRFYDALKNDAERTNRTWRRKLKRAAEAVAAATSLGATVTTAETAVVATEVAEAVSVVEDGDIGGDRKRQRLS
jgi:hypothetical protein